MEGGSSLCAGACLLSALTGPFLSVDRRRRCELSGVSSYNYTNPIMGPTLMISSNPIYPPKSPSPNANPLGLRASIYEFWGHIQLVHKSEEGPELELTVHTASVMQARGLCRGQLPQLGDLA